MRRGGGCLQAGWQPSAGEGAAVRGGSGGLQAVWLASWQLPSSSPAVSWVVGGCGGHRYQSRRATVGRPIPCAAAAVATLGGHAQTPPAA